MDADGKALELNRIHEPVVDWKALVAGFVTDFSWVEVSNRFSIEVQADSTVVNEFFDVSSNVDVESDSVDITGFV
jgi:hypothetical protein